MDWISVDEKLPVQKQFLNTHGEEISSDYVLVTVQDRCDKKRVTVGRYVKNGYFNYSTWKLLYGNKYGKIIAWKPLPEPYNKEDFK